MVSMMMCSEMGCCCRCCCCCRLQRSIDGQPEEECKKKRIVFWGREVLDKSLVVEVSFSMARSRICDLAERLFRGFKCNGLNVGNMCSTIVEIVWT